MIDVFECGTFSDKLCCHVLLLPGLSSYRIAERCNRAGDLGRIVVSIPHLRFRAQGDLRQVTQDPKFPRPLRGQSVLIVMWEKELYCRERQPPFDIEDAIQEWAIHTCNFPTECQFHFDAVQEVIPIALRSSSEVAVILVNNLASIHLKALLS